MTTTNTTSTRVRQKYLSMMKYSDGVIGNSSSGIIEAASFKIGTINIGDRQKGRFQADSVINCKPTTNSINSAFNKLKSKKIQHLLKNVKNPYGDGKTADRILKILNNYDLTGIIKKSFYNIK